MSTAPSSMDDSIDNGYFEVSLDFDARKMRIVSRRMLLTLFAVYIILSFPETCLAESQKEIAQGTFRKSVQNDGSINIWGDPTLCYEYTWKGPWNDRFNESDQSTCGSLNQKGMPCYHPFVWTYGEFKFNQPLPEVVDLACQQGDIYGNRCNPTCMKNSNTCCKMTYFIKGTDNIANATSFCCKGLSENTGQDMNSGCYTEKNVDGYDVEVCFCDKDRCNHSNLVKFEVFLILMPFILILKMMSDYYHS